MDLGNFRYDTQFLIEGENSSKQAIQETIQAQFQGDCLLVVGDENLIKIHFHTNKPGDLLTYGSSIGEIFDIVVENMFRQAAGKKG